MTVFTTVAAGDPDATVVAAVADKIIVLRSLFAGPATATQSSTFRLKSASTVVTPWFRIGTNGMITFESALGQIQTGRGEALKAENANGADGVTLLIAYEVRD